MLQRLKAAAQVLLRDPKNPEAYYFADAEDTPYDTVTPEIARRVAAVSNCINRLAEHISSLDWTCDDPRVKELLKKPNIIHKTTSAFFYALTYDLLLHGSAYIYRGLKETSFEYLIGVYPPNVNRTIVNKKLNYDLQPTSEFGDLIPSGRQPASDKNVIEIQDVPTSERMGTSTNDNINARRHQVEGSIWVCYDIQNMVRDLARNGPVAGAVVTSQKDEGDGWGERITKAISAKFGKGSKGRGGVLALDNGQTLTPFGPPLELSQTMVNYRRAEEIKICGAFGVPPFMVGITSDSDVKYSNLPAQHAAFYRDAVFPISDRIKESLSQAFGKEVYPDLTRLLAGDLGSSVRAAAEAYTSGIWKKSESRALTGQPVEEGDDVYVENPTSPIRPDESMDPNRPRQDDDPEQNIVDEEEDE